MYEGQPRRGQREPSSGSDRLVVTGRFVVEVESADAVLSALERYADGARRAPGCDSVELAASLGGEPAFLVVERWRSTRAHDAHQESAVFATLAREVGSLLARPPELAAWEAL